MEALGLSHPGLVREKNEDFFALRDQLGLAVLADGMGGANAGEVAAQLAVDTVVSFLTRSHDEIDDERLSTAVALANAKVLDASRAKAELFGMGTTLVVLKVSGERGYTANVGDSRIYRYRSGTLEQITKDHSVVQQMLDQGLITRDEARFAPNRNIVTRAVGAEEDVQTDVVEIDVSAGDVFVLCSDGLSDLVDDAEIERILAGHPANLADTAQALVDAAIAAGGTDNVTVVLVAE